MNHIFKGSVPALLRTPFRPDTDHRAPTPGPPSQPYEGHAADRPPSPMCSDYSRGWVELEDIPPTDMERVTSSKGINRNRSQRPTGPEAERQFLPSATVYGTYAGVDRQEVESSDRRAILLGCGQLKAPDLVARWRGHLRSLPTTLADAVLAHPVNAGAGEVAEEADHGQDDGQEVGGIGDDSLEIRLPNAQWVDGVLVPAEQRLPIMMRLPPNSSGRLSSSPTSSEDLILSPVSDRFIPASTAAPPPTPIEGVMGNRMQVSTGRKLDLVSLSLQATSDLRAYRSDAPEPRAMNIDGEEIDNILEDIDIEHLQLD